MTSVREGPGVDLAGSPSEAPSPPDEVTATREPRIGAHDAFTRAGALGLVSVATALGFGRIFSGAGFVGTLLAAAAIPHLVGGFARIRRWSTALTMALTTALTALVLVEIVAGETMAYGLPTATSARRIGHLLDAGWSVFRTGVAPVAAHRGVVLLCAIAVAACATAADAIGRRDDTTVGALGPTLVLFVLTGTLGSGDLRVPTTIGYVASALVAMVIANASRLAHRRTWFTGRRLASDAAVLRSAAGLGAAALLIGLVVTPLVPGVDSTALLKYRNHRANGGAGGLGDYQTVSPLVDLRERLGPQSNDELFRVASPRPLYWRLVALDRFDGQVWSVTSEARDAATAFRNVSKRNAVRQEFDITGLGDQWVPAAFAPVSTTMGNARIIPESSTLIAPNPIPGQRYEVLSHVEAPPTATERLATNRAVPPALQRALELPRAFPVALRRQARGITAGATTPYAKAEALQRFFTDGSFTYDLAVPPGDNSEAIGAFLRIRHGFCQQFAAAFAALARAAGLPARVVVGFTPGDFDQAANEYVVRGRNAHAWAEVWFAGLGWRTFEPTPSGSSPGQADQRANVAQAPPVAGATTTTSLASPPPSVRPGASSGSPLRPRSEIISTTSRSNGSSSSLRTAAAIAIPGLALLAALGGVVARLITRRRTRRRRRRAPDPTDRMAGAWREALEACARAGLPVSVALTPNEQVESLAVHGVPTPAVPALRELAQLSTDLAFSPVPPDDDAVERGWEAAAEVQDALLVGVGVRERAGRALRRSELPV